MAADLRRVGSRAVPDVPASGAVSVSIAGVVLQKRQRPAVQRFGWAYRVDRPGHHQVAIEPHQGTRAAPAGVYFYRVSAADGVKTGRFVLME